MTPDTGPKSRQGPRQAIALALSDIKLAHSVFAMPFAVLAAFMAAPVFLEDPSSLEPRASSLSAFLRQLLLILLCMFFARTWAMLVNRLADHRFDAANPRTAGRAVASGRLGVRSALIVALASALLFIATCAGFLAFGNIWPLALSAPVLGWIALYSFTKRFTALAHVFLGGALAASPIAAVIAINPELLWTWAPQARAAILLAGFVLFWVAGFDVAYALQDLDFDREAGLRSIPARLGPRGALWASRSFHLIAIALLIAANFPDTRMDYLFSFATLGVIAILIFEHVVLARQGVKGLPLAFFTLNGIVSVLLGVAGCVDVLV